MRTTLMLLLVSVTVSVFGALSNEYANFAKGPADLLLTKEERTAWARVRTDAEAKAFIDLFWARRDPTPATPANEFKTLVEDRARLADDKFGSAKLRGSETDRGKTFIVLGSPTVMRRSGTPAGGTVLGPPGQVSPGAIGGTTAPSMEGGAQNYGSREIWVYEQPKVEHLDLGQQIAQVGFIDQYSANEWKREHVHGTDFKALAERVASQYITQPQLTEAPKFDAAATETVAVQFPAASETPGAITTDALRAAVDAARTAKATSDKLYLNWGEYITADGQHFVPVHLYVPSTAGLSATGPVTFFGRVDKAEGGDAVVAFEEPVTLTASGDAFVYGRSLTLEPGSYQGTFGLARDGQPVAVVSRPITVTGLDKDAATVSQLILSNNVYPLPEAQLPTDPYAFGGLKVVPKGDSTFRQSEELWYFIEARNPGLDPATNQPNMTMKITVAGKTTDGRNVKMAGAAAATQAIEIRGVPGHYGLGQAMPLQTFKPGEYTIKIQVKDQVLGKTYDVEQPFTVVQ